MEKHEEINKNLEYKINEERIKRLELKHTPKTKIQRIRGFFLLLVGIGFVCQFISALLASSGVMYYLSTKLNDNGLIISLTAIGLLLGLEAAKRFTLESYHHQRLDDKHINKITYCFIFGLGVVSVFSTYIGTPHAVEFFSASPELVDIELLTLEQNEAIKKDTAYWNSKKVEALASALHIHTSNSWKGRTSRDARPMVLEYKNTSNAAQDSLNKSLVLGQSVLSKTIETAKTENKATLTNRLVWCKSFGSALAIVSILLELLFFISMFWCEGFKRLEVAEAKEVLKLQSKGVESPKVKEASRDKDTVKELNTNTLTPIGFNQPLTALNAKEGQIVKGQGAKADRVAVMKKDGTLKLYTKGALDNLIKVSSTERGKELETLKNKLS